MMPTPTPLPPPVSYEKTTFAVERGPIVSEFTVVGEVLPSRQDELFFRASGFVSRVTVQPGDTAKAGELLAELQVDDLLKQLEQARIDLEVAQAKLADDERARRYAIARAEHRVAIRQIQVDLARAALTEDADSPIDQTTLELQLKLAEENLALAELDLEEVSEEVSLYQKQAVERAQLTVERLEAQLSERQIMAPYDCIILPRRGLPLRPGDSAQAFSPVFIVGDPTELVIGVPINQKRVDEIRENTEVYVSLTPDLKELYEARFMPGFFPLSSKMDEGSAASLGQDMIYFAIPLSPGRDEIPVGRTVYVRVVLGRRDDALLLPPATIRSFRGRDFVILQEGERRRRVDIQIGLETDERVEVIGDLQEGDQIVGP